MNIENIEYWVVKSMEEASISLQNGEVPVGCLFLIRKESLESFAKVNAQSSDGKRLEVGGIRNEVEENLPEVSKKETKIGLNGDKISEILETAAASTIDDKSGGYTIIARGKNEVNATKNATRHAEMVCIDQIVEMCNTNNAKVFENLTVIVNVEPCIMCMAALLDLNVRTIVFTCVNDRFGYNTLGNAERTNYVEIVENQVAEELGFEGKVTVLDKIATTTEGSCKEVVKAFNSVEKEQGTFAEQSPNDELLADKDEIIDKSMRSESIEMIQEDSLNTEGKDLAQVYSDVEKENVNESRVLFQYRLSFMGKYLLANRNDKILSKISSFLDDRRLNLCNVLHYKKYESETMDILKLFYKGVNPNAPKNKVKIKN